MRDNACDQPLILTRQVHGMRLWTPEAWNKKRRLYAAWVLLCLGAVAMPVQAGERYVDNGDGTITDRENNLVVLKQADCFGKQSWQAAISEARKLAAGACGLSDGSRPGAWHLPARETLPLLVEWSKSGFFSGMQTHFYWSNTPYVSDTPRAWAWVMYLGNGYVGKDEASNGNYLWPVRSLR